jgi:hypothetical protein
VIPDTLVGLLAFAASIGPGYVYVWIAERYELRPTRGPLLEAAQLVIIGSVASLVSLLAVLGFAEMVNVIDTAQVADDGGRYVITEPVRSLSSLLVALVLSYGGAAAAAWFIHRGRTPSIRVGDPAWHGVFERSRKSDEAVWVTVELEDGRRLSGNLGAYTAQTDAPNELTLWKPISVLTPAGLEAELSDDFLVIDSDAVVYVAGEYRPGELSERRLRTTGWRRDRN